MGAKVTGIDIDEHRIEKANFIKELIKPNANIEYKKVDIYSDDLNDLEHFDISVLIHTEFLILLGQFHF